MDIKMDYDFTKRLLMKLGEEDFLQLFNFQFPQLELYSFGYGWLESSEYILKFRGSHGDLIVRWE